MSRFIMIAMLAMILALGGCAPPETQDQTAGNGQEAAKPSQKEPSKEEPADPEVGDGTGEAAKAEPEGSGSGDTEDEPDPAAQTTGPAPEEVLATQYGHINSGNYGAAYDLFDDASRDAISLDQYRAYFEESVPYEIEDYSFSSVRAQGGEASVVADLDISSSDGDESYEVTQELVREGGDWHIVMRDEQIDSFSAAGDSSASATASATAEPEEPGRNLDRTVTVSRVVDGDTIEVSPAVGGITDVRLIGIDTPETVDPGEEVEPYGPEASAFATEKLTGQSVALEFGAERTDQYDRLLAYVYVSSEMFNEALLEEGYAQAYPYEPNTEYEGRFASAQEVAKASDLGIWGLTLSEQCQLANHGNGIGEGAPGCEEGSVSPSASASASSNASAIASPSPSSPAPRGGGGVSSGGGDIDCDQVDGPIPTPPGDPDGLDGDGDGWACE